MATLSSFIALPKNPKTHFLSGDHFHHSHHYHFHTKKGTTLNWKSCSLFSCNFFSQLHFPLFSFRFFWGCSLCQVCRFYLCAPVYFVILGYSVSPCFFFLMKMEEIIVLGMVLVVCDFGVWFQDNGEVWLDSFSWIVLRDSCFVSLCLFWGEMKLWKMRMWTKLYYCVYCQCTLPIFSF